MENINITIVGAGVVGLAVAAELSEYYNDIFLVEKNFSFGQETSSRNSEVIHAGIYYPKDSFKTRTCVEGRRLLYDYCRKNNISHKKTGKLIVAIERSEVSGLEELLKRGLENGVSDLKFLSKDEIKAMEPNIKSEAAIYSPSTGIIDSHGLMKDLVSKFEKRGGQIAYSTELTALEKFSSGFKAAVTDDREGKFEFFTGVLINCAGLNSDKVAQMSGIDRDNYRLKYCKGDYFRVHNNKARFINRLIYPAPEKQSAGLGIHATLDLGGGLRLGPDDKYIEKIDYSVDVSKTAVFYESVRQFLPFIELEDVAPDTSGVRPKLQGPGEVFRDFIIKDEAEAGFPGLINLIGIESPGLTACLSIAKLVKNLAAAALRG
ncbi:MAG: NAD(P)/FAD-dependent oxidoreductase [Candidatus Omnitrophota bacterium]